MRKRWAVHTYHGSPQDHTTMEHMGSHARLLANAKKLKAKVLDTATVLELYNQAQERERQLEAAIMQERSGKAAARTQAERMASTKVTSLQKEIDALSAQLRDSKAKEQQARP